MDGLVMEASLDKNSRPKKVAVAVVLCLWGNLVAVVLRYCGTVVMW